MTKIKKWLSPEELAAIIGVTTDEVLFWAESGQLPAEQTETSWKFDTKKVQPLLDKHGASSPHSAKKGSSKMQAQFSDSIQPPISLSESPSDPSTRSRTGLFAKALMKDMIEILPTLPDTDSLETIRNYLRNNIHYNALQTRERFASYILKHAFPSGKPDAELRKFARKFPSTTALKDVCLYRFIQSQPLMQSFILEILVPALGQGIVPRSKLNQFLSTKFPSANQKSLQSTSAAICEVLASSGLAQVDKSSIRFGLRTVPLEAFAFVLHSEFREPGMHHFHNLEANITSQVLLWHPDKVNQALYELRNRGLIAKISDIDGLRQFTTRYSLLEVVEHMHAVGALA